MQPSDCAVGRDRQGGGGKERAVGGKRGKEGGMGRGKRGMERGHHRPDKKDCPCGQKNV